MTMGKKLIGLALSLVLTAGAAFAGNRDMWSPSFGFGSATVNSNPSSSTFAVNSAIRWLAQGFQPSHNATISKVRFAVSAVSGTLDADDITCEIYSALSDATNPGNPNASLASTTTVTTTPTGQAEVECTGFSQAVSPGTKYFIVIKNTAAVPGTNNFTIRYPSTAIAFPSRSQMNHTAPVGAGIHTFSTTDSGTTWAVASSGNGAPFAQIEYADGTYDGSYILQVAVDSTDSVYSTREVGAIFTTPRNARLRLAGVVAAVARVSTPTGNVRYRLWKGSGGSPTLVATTAVMAPLMATFTTAKFVELSFASVQVLEPNTTYRITLAETTQSDASTERLQTYAFTVANTAGGLASRPVGGTMHWTYFDGTSWTETTTKFPSMWFVLDESDPFYHVQIQHGSSG